MEVEVEVEEVVLVMVRTALTTNYLRWNELLVVEVVAEAVLLMTHSSTHSSFLKSKSK